MDSSESSDQALDVRLVAKTLRDVRAAIKILGEWTDGISEEVLDVVHVRLNNVVITVQLIDMRAHAEVAQQVESLPGSAPTLKV